MSRVLITGASGFIGRGTLAPLLQRGLEVHAVTSRSSPPDAQPGIRWHTADLLDSHAAEAMVEQVRPTHLLHLAWYAEPGAYWSSPENLRWVEASLRLLRAFAQRGGARAVFAGTCAEYEWSNQVTCDELSTPCRPATLYGTSKHALQLIGARYAKQVGLSFAWGRVFFVFGPAEHPARVGGSVARSLVLGEPTLLSHGQQVRDFLYSGDLAEAFVALLDSGVEGPVNLASGNPMTIRQLVESLAQAAGRSDLLQFGARPAPDGEPSVLGANVERLRDEVGWVPGASLERRAAETIAWWQSHLSAAGQPPARG